MFKYFFASFFAAALWGFMAIPLRNLVEWPAEDILYYRIIISTLIIWPVIFLFRKKAFKKDISLLKAMPTKDRKKYLLGIGIATLLILGNWFSFIYGVNHISIQSAAFAYMVCPLLTTLLAFIFLKERLSRFKIVSLLIVLLSVILLASASLVEVMWSITIGGLYACYLIIQKLLSSLDKLNQLAAQLTLSFLIILPFLLYQNHNLPQDFNFWLNIVIISVFFTIIPLYLSLYALNGIPSSTAGVLIYINPIISFSVAILYFQEEVDSTKFLAYSILLIGVALFNIELFYKSKSQKKIHSIQH